MAEHQALLQFGPSPIPMGMDLVQFTNPKFQKVIGVMAQMLSQDEKARSGLHITVFMNNKSQAIRLPKPVALPESVKRVEIVKVGAARLIAPVDIAWDSFFDGPRVSDDFASDRRQPPAQKRDAL